MTLLSESEQDRAMTFIDPRNVLSGSDLGGFSNLIHQAHKELTGKRRLVVARLRGDADRCEEALRGSHRQSALHPSSVFRPC